MKSSTGPMLFISVLVSTSARADDYQPSPLERAPKKKIECSWSKLSASEYSECQKRAEYYENQTPEERRKQNIEATKAIADQTAVTEEDGAGRAARRARRAGRKR